MTTYTFTGPKRKAERTGTCPTCGKPSKRSRTFERTVSPFNKRPDGEPKTWAEVADDVKAEADAWDPGPEVFEHEKCLAERMAPPAAEPIVMSDAAQAGAEALRLALADAVLWLERTGLPVGSSVEIGLRRGRHQIVTSTDTRPDVYWLARVHGVHAGEVPMWARALGLAEVVVNGSTMLEVTGDGGGIRWDVVAVVPEPEYGPKLGGATVRKGDPTRRPMVGVDDLAAGLARMGIAEVLPAPGSALHTVAKLKAEQERKAPLLDELREAMRASS